MNHVILLPSGEGIRNQLISVIDFLFFFLFFLNVFENITVPCIHLWNEKCNYCAKGSGVGFGICSCFSCHVGSSAWS